jgi:hypothetical protein
MNRPRTEAQLEASRTNGALSKGPVTDEGKAISSLNATRHGLLSGSALLPGEEKEEYERLLAIAIAKYEPEDEEELHLVNLMVFHQWRQLRICGIQLAGQLGEILSQTEDPPALLDTDMSWRAYVAFRDSHLDRRCHELLHRYEVSFENRYDRKRRELQRLKRERDGSGGGR